MLLIIAALPSEAGLPNELISYRISVLRITTSKILNIALKQFKPKLENFGGNLHLEI